MKKLILLLLVIISFTSCEVYRPVHRIGYRGPRRTIIITRPLVPYGVPHFSAPRGRNYSAPRRSRH